MKMLKNVVPELSRRTTCLKFGRGRILGSIPYVKKLDIQANWLSYYDTFGVQSLVSESYIISQKSFCRKCSTYFHISDEVQNAIDGNDPVVALESAIITHGMPFPTNIETAFRIQEIIRSWGVVPATVGVIHGKVKVGLTDPDIEFLGSKTGNGKTREGNNDTTDLVKVSRRDFPVALSKKLSGGTTVAGTIVAASKANIPIFATGGIGGVHRGAELTFDISCDLKELGRNPIAVVSAGVKSILDIGKTLEYLETEGVCVGVMKKRSPEVPDSDPGPRQNRRNGTLKFPSFFVAQSQFSAPFALTDQMEAATLIHSAFQFQLGSGILIAVPIPEEFEADGEEIEEAVKAALQKGKDKGIEGKEVTPFLLSEINRVTKGNSLRANQALIQNNVSIASQIAVELSKLRKGESLGGNDTTASSASSSFNKRGHLSDPIPPSLPGLETDRHEKEQKDTSCLSKTKSTSSHLSQDEKEEVEPHLPKRVSGSKPDNASISLGSGRPVVIGGSSLDIIMGVEEDQIVNDGRTHRAVVQTSPGGVGRNIGEALAKLGNDPILISSIGKDTFGRTLLDDMTSYNMETRGITIATDPKLSTPIYAAVLNQNRECFLGIGDMTLHSYISPRMIEKHAGEIKSASIVLVDGNLPIETMRVTMKICSEYKVPVWFEPTEVRKAQKILKVPKDFWSSLTFMSPNLKELESLTQAISTSEVEVNKAVAPSGTPGGERTQTEINSVIFQSFSKFPGLRLLLLTRGKNGFMVAHRKPGDSPSQFSLLDFPSPGIEKAEIKSVSGAGDCLNAGFISGLLGSLTLEECGVKGRACAGASLLSMRNVPPSFNTVI